MRLDEFSAVGCAPFGVVGVPTDAALRRSGGAEHLPVQPRIGLYGGGFAGADALFLAA